LPFADAFRKAGNPSIPAPNSDLSDKKPQTILPRPHRTFPFARRCPLSPRGPQAFIGDENAGCAPAFHFGKERAMPKPRRRFKLTQSLKDRLGVFARLMREGAEAMPLGVEKSATPAKAEQAEFEADVERWVNSPELRPPK
jgi:hypothetical protein